MTTPIRNIVAYIDPTPDNAALYEGIVQLAKKTGAHVTGLYAITPLSVVTAATMSGPIPTAVLNEYTQAVDAQARKHEATFMQTMRDAGIQATWQCETGRPDDVVCAHFRYADVGIVRQTFRGEASEHQRVVNAAILNSGRPVIVIPFIGTKSTLAERVVIGWNNGVQCTRAVHDALPLIKDAKWAHVINVDKSTSTDILGSAVPITEHLARHGVTVEASTYPKTTLDPGDVLLNHAADNDADLIVAGAWGHSRATEFVFGGTTRALLEHMTVPVLFSH